MVAMSGSLMGPDEVGAVLDLPILLSSSSEGMLRVAYLNPDSAAQAGVAFERLVSVPVWTALRQLPAGAGTMRDDRARFQLRAQIDVEALRAQFDFGEGILLDYEGQGGRVAFLGRSNDVLFVILGTPDRGWGSNRRRAAWWTAWNATPHARVPFANPFADLPG